MWLYGWVRVWGGLTVEILLEERVGGFEPHGVEVDERGTGLVLCSEEMGSVHEGPVCGIHESVL